MSATAIQQFHFVAINAFELKHPVEISPLRLIELDEEITELVAERDALRTEIFRLNTEHRAQLAAAQAREARLRVALAYMVEAHTWTANESNGAAELAMDLARAALEEKP